jgi:hypothetical protein
MQLNLTPLKVEDTLKTLLSIVLMVKFRQDGLIMLTQCPASIQVVVVGGVLTSIQVMELTLLESGREPIVAGKDQKWICG